MSKDNETQENIPEWRKKLPNNGEPKFIVDSNGHLKKGKKKENSSFNHYVKQEEPAQCNFAFTPVGFNEATVIADTRLEGVRKELGKTSPLAYTVLHKHQNVKRTDNSFKKKKDPLLDTLHPQFNGKHPVFQ